MKSNLLIRAGIIPANTQVRVRSIALPPEHGAWGFLLEPLLLGLIVAPSVAGFGLCVTVIGAFLLRQPMKIVYNDRQRGKRYERTHIGERFLALYGALALAGILIAVIAGGFPVIFPLVAALPVAAVQLLGTLWHKGRDILPELAGAAALGIAAPAITLAGGIEPVTAFGLWAVLLGRAIPSILYVRARLRLEKNQPVKTAPATALSFATVLLVGTMALAEWLPWLGVIALGVLTIRAALGLSRHRKPRAAKTIGFQEIAYGLLVVLLTVIGHYTGI